MSPGRAQCKSLNATCPSLKRLECSCVFSSGITYASSLASLQTPLFTFPCLLVTLCKRSICFNNHGTLSGWVTFCNHSCRVFLAARTCCCRPISMAFSRHTQWVLEPGLSSQGCNAVMILYCSPCSTFVAHIKTCMPQHTVHHAAGKPHAHLHCNACN